jgi:hypothetical protein
VEEYQVISGNHIVITKSEANARTYSCGSHAGCCFRAKFGRQRATNTLVLKQTKTCAYHNDVSVATADGRSPKCRIQTRLAATVDTVAAVKMAKPVAADIMKAAATIDGVRISYNKAFRAIQKDGSKFLDKNIRSFQRIFSSLQSFNQLNPGSTATAQRDSDNNIERLFLCPSVMNESMAFVRPIISLDRDV